MLFRTEPLPRGKGNTQQRQKPALFYGLGSSFQYLFFQAWTLNTAFKGEGAGMGRDRTTRLLSPHPQNGNTSKNVSLLFLWEYGGFLDISFLFNFFEKISHMNSIFI